MKDELVDKTALMTSVLDQKAAEKAEDGIHPHARVCYVIGDDEGAKADKKLAELFARAGDKIRAIAERIENRISILDAFAKEFLCDKGRYPSKEEQNAEMEKRGLRKDSNWTI